MRCEGYGLGSGHCYDCPNNANCQTRSDGFDVVAVQARSLERAGMSPACQPGILAPLGCLQPFVESCISNNTIEILRSNGAWHHLQLGRPAVQEELHSGSVTAASSEEAATLAPKQLCAAIVTSPDDVIAQTSGRANIYRCPGVQFSSKSVLSQITRYFNMA